MTLFLILSKLLIFCLAPATWIIVLLIWRYFAINNVLKKRLAIAAFVIFLLFSNEFLFTRAGLAWQPPVTNLSNQQYEAGIILGGVSAYDKHGKGYFKEAADRFIQACKLYHSGYIKKVIASGGSLWGDEPGEAIFLKQELLAQGIPDSNIVIESRSRNTFENAAYTKKLLDSMQVKGEVLLITSAMHMPRASGIFKKAGVNIAPFPCDYRVIDSKVKFFDCLVPQINILDSWGLLIKEMFGTLSYKIAGKI